MLDRPEIRFAASTVSLGMLADEALIAIIKYQDGRELDQSDQTALERVKDLLQTISEFGSRRVIRSQLLKSMASIATLDQTFETISRAQLDEEDFSSFTAHLAVTAGHIANGGSGKSPDIDALKTLLERLSSMTFEDSKEAVKPSRSTRGEWIRRALNS